MIPFAAQTIETLANQLLNYDPDTQAKLATLNGKTIAFFIQDWNIAFYIVIDQKQLQVYTGHAKQPDAAISGKLNELFKLARHKKGYIEIKGDVELGLTIRQILSHIDIDWEELLAQWSNDTLAHHTIKTAKKAHSAGKDIQASLTQAAKDFLQHEAKLLPTRSQVEQFCQDVTDIRQDTERLEAKIRKLHC